MKAYTVIRLPDNVFSLGLHNTQAPVFDAVDAAREHAHELARRYPGVSHAVVEGSVVEAYRAEPVMVHAVAVDV
jgi:hypothetical protein